MILYPNWETNSLSPVEEHCLPLQYRIFVLKLLRGKGAICWIAIVHKQFIFQDNPIKRILHLEIFEHLCVNRLYIGLLYIWFRIQSLNTWSPFAKTTIHLVRNKLSLSSVLFPVYLLYMLMGLRSSYFSFFFFPQIDPLIFKCLGCENLYVKVIVFIQKNNLFLWKQTNYAYVWLLVVKAIMFWKG